MTTKTTKKRYEKYEDLSKTRGVKWFKSSCKRILGLSYDQLLQKFKEDPHLNNIPLSVWDGISTGMMPVSKQGLSLAECVCLQKHCAIYQCLEIEPEFKD